MTELLLKLFVKNSRDTENEQVRAGYGKLAGAVGICCNLLLCAAKLLIGFLSGAVSIMADAVNNLSDASSSIITLLGFKLSAKPADEKHPYGHARVEYLSGLAVAVLILVIGVELAISSVKKIITYFGSTPEAADPTSFWAVVIVLVLSIGVKLWMMLFNHKLGKKISSATLAATAADSRNDVISSAAVLAAYILEISTGWHIDGYAGAGVALFILWSGVEIAGNTISPLLGEAVDPALSKMVAREIGKHDMILGIHDLMVHDYGPGRRFASVHVEIDQKQDVMAAHDQIDEIEMEFREKHNISLVIHYDPVVTDDAELNRMRDYVSEAVRRIAPSLVLHDFRMVRGPKHTNLIFDLVIPFRMKGQEQALKQQIYAQVQQQDTRYYTVITFDYATGEQMEL